MNRVCALLMLTVSMLACLASAGAAASADSSIPHGGRRERRCGVRARRHARNSHAACQTPRRSRGHHTRARRESPALDALTSSDAASLARQVTIARVLATPCQNAEELPESGNLEQIREAVLCLINQVRAQNGETPLTPNRALEQAAESHTDEMIADDYFEHVSPSGVTPVGRDEASGYIPGPTVGYVIGENLAWGTLSLATPQAIVAAWVASPGHLANILEGEYRDTGIGVTPEVPAFLAAGAPGATYAQEFGVIID
jgi:uncharacterized protein YkwD